MAGAFGPDHPGSIAVEGGRSTMSEPYQIQYASDSAEYLRTLRTYDRRRLLEQIQRHLSYQPRFESKSRIKLMAQPFWSTYRLHVDEFRVYYEVDDEAHSVRVTYSFLKGTEPTPGEQP
ncbi:MAG TPA: hypothetical protein VG406_00290 [Isosphaeraceae bacterium]|nr:hypothetical protein [Isosphaeraceae bacterium]